MVKTLRNRLRALLREHSFTCQRPDLITARKAHERRCLTGEQLEPRIALDAAGIQRPTIEPTHCVFISNTGPSAIVIERSDITTDTDSFVVTSVTNGSVEKWTDAHGWVDVSTTPTTANPAGLLTLLQRRVFHHGDRLRWLPYHSNTRSDLGQTESLSSPVKAFEVLGWGNNSAASTAQETPSLAPGTLAVTPTTGGLCPTPTHGYGSAAPPSTAPTDTQQYPTSLTIVIRHNQDDANASRTEANTKWSTDISNDVADRNFELNVISSQPLDITPKNLGLTGAIHLNALGRYAAESYATALPALVQQIMGPNGEITRVVTDSYKWPNGGNGTSNPIDTVLPLLRQDNSILTLDLVVKQDPGQEDYLPWMNETVRSRLTPSENDSAIVICSTRQALTDNATESIIPYLNDVYDVETSNAPLKGSTIFVYGDLDGDATNGNEVQIYHLSVSSHAEDKSSAFAVFGEFAVGYESDPFIDYGKRKE
jgi:hypothetical protein